jgi:2-polyprenyl-3-methyl-5-hydroxy-6-metoxy-1,4-benzoquinol methylase
MSGYLFDPSWSDERRRLALIERVYDPVTTSRLEQLGVGAGWRCVDVGAGGGSVARWLRDQVGPDGSVVAVDLDTRFFENERGVESRRLDILADELERDAYDLVHCRLLLHHLRGKQLDAAQRMVAALRPGGVLLASEPNSVRCWRRRRGLWHRCGGHFTKRCRTPTMPGRPVCRRPCKPPA